MRTRVWLTSAALGAALLTGSTVATAQAAAASSEARVYTDIGTFRSEAACRSFGRAGVYTDWFCQRSSTTSNYHLWVNLDS